MRLIVLELSTLSSIYLRYVPQIGRCENMGTETKLYSNLLIGFSLIIKYHSIFRTITPPKYLYKCMRRARNDYHLFSS